MKHQTRFVTVAGILLAFLPLLLFKTPANTMRSGNELSALAWILAKNNGEGTWEFFPMNITVEIGELVTFVEIENCGSSVLPDTDLSEQIPFPFDFTQENTTVSIIFSEIP